MTSAFFSGMRDRVFSRYFAALFLLYLAGIFAILRANRLYLDDLGRALYGYADWIESARPLSELMSFIFYLGPITVDASPLSQILAAVLLALASLLLFDAVRARPSWSGLLCTAPVGLSPYQLENLSYRFDAPWMALAVVLAVLPWSFYRAGKWRFFTIAALCIFASLSLYQPAIGAYLAVAVYRLLADVSARGSLPLVGKRALRLGLPFVCGAGAYAAQASLWFRKSQYGDYVAQHSMLPDMADLPGKIAENIAHYLSLLAHDWHGNGVGALLGVIIVAFAVLLLARLFRSRRVAGASGGALPAVAIRIALLAVLLLCLLLTPFGIQFVLDNPVWPPRTFQGFGVMVSLMLLYLHASATRNALHRIFSALQVFFVLQLLVFAQVYGNLLDAQGQWELSRIGLLAADLNRFIRKTGSSQVDFVGSIGLSPLVRAPAAKYPLLGRLVAVPLTRDWRWGYEQLITYGVKVDREDIPENVPTESLTPFLETPNYRIDVTPEGVGRITFLDPPVPRPQKKRPRALKGQ